MAFEPLGYRFEIKSSLTVANAKAAIRSRKKGWFDPKSGARGWIAGPFICLWFNAFDRYGPMLAGIVSRDDQGTQIRGRAGSDLNGVLMFLVLLPLMLVLLSVTEGSGSFREIIFFGLIFIGGPLFLWWSHQERRQAEPLVRFLRHALAGNHRDTPEGALMVRSGRPLRLTINGVEEPSVATQELIYQALLSTGEGDTVVLAASDELYIQTLGRNGGFILETREGDRNHHYIAVRPEDTRAKDGSAFTFEEAAAAFASFLSDAPGPPYVRWQPLSLP